MRSNLQISIMMKINVAACLWALYAILSLYH
jgi:hypothetical protein